MQKITLLLSALFIYLPSALASDASKKSCNLVFHNSVERIEQLRSLISIADRNLVQIPRNELFELQKNWYLEIRKNPTSKKSQQLAQKFLSSIDAYLLDLVWNFVSPYSKKFHTFDKFELYKDLVSVARMEALEFMINPERAPWLPELNPIFVNYIKQAVSKKLYNHTLKMEFDSKAPFSHALLIFMARNPELTREDSIEIFLTTQEIGLDYAWVAATYDRLASPKALSLDATVKSNEKSEDDSNYASLSDALPNTQISVEEMSIATQRQDLLQKSADAYLQKLQDKDLQIEIFKLSLAEIGLLYLDNSLSLEKIMETYSMTEEYIKKKMTFHRAEFSKFASNKLSAN